MTETVDYQPATGHDVVLSGAAPRPDHIGQSTSIEQTRAVAEVEALVIVAQRRPRNEEDALRQMMRSTQIKELADRAFYEYPRGGQKIKDLSIVAVKELARCWGNMQYAVVELRQDLGRNESEMLAWAWDMQANNRVERRKIVPHVRDSNASGRKVITDFREIGEILGNWAARQLRECIKDILPPWYVDQAKTGFNDTLLKGLKNKPIEVARVEAITAFEDAGVTREQLERNLNRPSSVWTVHDLANLRIKFTAIGRGELRVEDEFPSAPLKGADVVAAPLDPALAAAVEPPTTAETPAPPVNDVEPPAGDDEGPTEDNDPLDAVERAGKAQVAKLHTLLKQLGIVDRLEKLRTIRTLAKRPEVSFEELRKAEAAGLIDLLDRCLSDQEPVMALDHVLSAYADESDKDSEQ